MIDQNIPGDSQKVELKRYSALLIPWQCPPGSEEYFFRQILCILSLFKMRIHKAKNPWCMMLIQFAKGICITLLSFQDQCVVIHVDIYNEING
jgi:hypothetical protein